jgi:hypothetical protein
MIWAGLWTWLDNDSFVDTALRNLCYAGLGLIMLASVGTVYSNVGVVRPIFVDLSMPEFPTLSAENHFEVAAHRTPGETSALALSSVLSTMEPSKDTKYNTVASNA